jgi:LysM repeat protein
VSSPDSEARRRSFARYAAPVAFLAVITIGVLLVRAGLRQGRQHANAPTVTAATTLAQTTSTGKKPHHPRTYRVQPGDTFDSIARKNGTTVARLEQLNPGVDPTSLQVGQKIRVQ